MRVAVLDDYQGVAHAYADWGVLPEGTEVTVFTEHISDTDALVEALAPFDVIAAMRERTAFTAERLARLPALRLLVTTGMGNAAIDMVAAREHGVTVCGTSGSAPDTAELTWGLILALARRIPAEDRSVRSGGWQHSVGTGLHGRTLGVVGLGRLGRRVARIGKAFGMDVMAWSLNLDPAKAEREGVAAVSRKELFSRADIVTVHYTLGERSRGLIGAADLGMMKPTAFLVNTSRGPIVDEAALVAALHDGTIAGAALDVYDVEPLPVDHPLRSAPNTVLTPHIGYVTGVNYEIFYRETVEDIAAFAQGAPIRVLNAG